jgi:hypothetical protein
VWGVPYVPEPDKDIGSLFKRQETREWQKETDFFLALHKKLGGWGQKRGCGMVYGCGTATKKEKGKGIILMEG